MFGFASQPCKDRMDLHADFSLDVKTDEATHMKTSVWLLWCIGILTGHDMYYSHTEAFWGEQHGSQAGWKCSETAGQGDGVGFSGGEGAGTGAGWECPGMLVCTVVGGTMLSYQLVQIWGRRGRGRGGSTSCQHQTPKMKLRPLQLVCLLTHGRACRLSPVFDSYTLSFIMHMCMDFCVHACFYFLWDEYSECGHWIVQ